MTILARLAFVFSVIGLLVWLFFPFSTLINSLPYAKGIAPASNNLSGKSYRTYNSQIKSIIIPCSNKKRYEQLRELIVQNSDVLSDFEVLAQKYITERKDVAFVRFPNNDEQKLQVCGSLVELRRKKEFSSPQEIDYSKTIRGKILHGWETEQTFENLQNESVFRIHSFLTSGDLTSMFRQNMGTVSFLLTDGEIGPYVSTEDSSRGELQCPCYEKVTLFLSDLIPMNSLEAPTLNSNTVSQTGQ